MQCGHFVPRQYLAVRYDEANCHTQCYACNMLFNGQPSRFAMNLERDFERGRLRASKPNGRRWRRSFRRGETGALPCCCSPDGRQDSLRLREAGPTQRKRARPVGDRTLSASSSITGTVLGPDYQQRSIRRRSPNSLRTTVTRHRRESRPSRTTTRLPVVPYRYPSSYER